MALLPLLLSVLRLITMTADDYELTLKLGGVFLIIFIIVYVALSSRESQE
jgi:hypothetical protein